MLDIHQVRLYQGRTLYDARTSVIEREHTSATSPPRRQLPHALKKAKPASWVTAAIVPRRLRRPRPTRGIDDNALAFVDGSISETTNVGLGNDDTTLH